MRLCFDDYCALQALGEHGTATPEEIGKRLSMTEKEQRKLYDCLDRLHTMGLASHYESGAHQVYFASPIGLLLRAKKWDELKAEGVGVGK